ncbi:hypothetical protein L9F63_018215, partial [Diploptera punctata]
HLYDGNQAFQTGFWTTLNLNLSSLHLMSHVLELWYGQLFAVWNLSHCRLQVRVHHYVLILT